MREPGNEAKLQEVSLASREPGNEAKLQEVSLASREPGNEAKLQEVSLASREPGNEAKVIPCFYWCWLHPQFANQQLQLSCNIQ